VPSCPKLSADARQGYENLGYKEIGSLHHTMPTRLGMLGVDAFSIMKIGGHSSITISRRYVYPSPESVERAFEER
jgi:hypothetical protein